MAKLRSNYKIMEPRRENKIRCDKLDERHFLSKCCLVNLLFHHKTVVVLVSLELMIIIRVNRNDVVEKSSGKYSSWHAH